MALWLAGLAVPEFRSRAPESTFRGLVLVAVALAPLAYIALYFQDYARPAHHTPSAGVWPSLQIASQALTMAFGLVTKPLWPVSAIVMIAFGLWCVGRLFDLLKRPSDRDAALGLLLVLGATAVILFAIGWGRSGLDADVGAEVHGYTMGFWARYAFLAWPAIGVGYFLALRWSPLVEGRRVQQGLFVVALLAFGPNMGFGAWNGIWRFDFQNVIFRAARSGLTVEQMLLRPEPFAAVGGGLLWGGNEEVGPLLLWGVGEDAAIDRGLRRLRDVGFNDFRFLAPDDPSAPAEAPPLLPGSNRRVPVAVWWVLAGLVLVPSAYWLWRVTHDVRVERARELFRLQHERLERMFLAAATRTGLPRGLRWTSCEFAGDVELARERGTGRLLALVPVTIRFTAVEGGDMEGLPAVDLPRHATAVFELVRGHWEATGRAVFNLLPLDALKHFGERYERLEGH
jgi:hypothetical protein